MSKTSPSKDGNLEVIDSILSAIKEHDKDLDKLLTELASIAKQKGEKDTLIDKFGRIEVKIDSLQKDINKLREILSLYPDGI